MNGEAGGERRDETTGAATLKQNGYILQKSDSQVSVVTNIMMDLTNDIEFIHSSFPLIVWTIRDFRFPTEGSLFFADFGLLFPA